MQGACNTSLADSSTMGRGDYGDPCTVNLAAPFTKGPNGDMGQLWFAIPDASMSEILNPACQGY